MRVYGQGESVVGGRLVVIGVSDIIVDCERRRIEGISRVVPLRTFGTGTATE